MLNEKLLLQRAYTFNEQALAEIYDRYSPGLYRYAMRLLGDAGLAEECVSETFSRFLGVLRRGKGPKNFLKAYLYRTAHNWVSDHYRRKPPDSIPLDPDLRSDGALEPLEVITQEIERRQIRAALAALTPEQRQAVALKYLEGWKNEQIAQSMGKSVGAVKALQRRALGALRRDLLSPEDEEDAG